jgi:hypothetical protein
VIDFVPALRDEVVNAAVPPFKATVASVLVPERNVTMPVTPGDPAAIVTVAVKVTDCP